MGRASKPPAPAGSADTQHQQGTRGHDVAPTKGEQTRQAILQAAIARFGRDGYRATSVADIARDANVGGTLTYAYFPNKEALFLAALDEDAAGVIEEGVVSTLDSDLGPQWSAALMGALLAAVEQHPLARRVMAGLEPHATERMIDIPALTQLRKAIADRLEADQIAGVVRPDIDPVAIANGAVTITLSLLMSMLQFGVGNAEPYANDVLAVFEAAIGRNLTPPRPLPDA